MSRGIIVLDAGHGQFGNAYPLLENTYEGTQNFKLAGKLKDMGETVAYEQVLLAVSDFEKGNMRLTLVLQSLDVK